MLGKWDKYMLQHRASVCTDKRSARQTDRQTDGHIGREKACQADTQTDRQIYRQRKDCQANRQAYRKKVCQAN
jgi:hypothetical protein